MKLAKILLGEENQPRQKVVDLNSLTFDLLVSMFGEKPSFGFKLPNADDSYTSIFDQRSLDSWKSDLEPYGNVKIKIDTEASSPWEKVQILDDKFRSDKEKRTARKAAWLSKERGTGRSSGLD